MIDTDKYEGHTEGPWTLCCSDQTSSSPPRWIVSEVEDVCEELTGVTEPDAQLIADAPILLKEVKRLREQVELLRSLGMGKDGIEGIVVDRLNAEVERLREDNEKLHDAINRSFHKNISGSAWEIYNGWWEGEDE